MEHFLEMNVPSKKNISHYLVYTSAQCSVWTPHVSRTIFSSTPAAIVVAHVAQLSAIDVTDMAVLNPVPLECCLSVYTVYVVGHTPYRKEKLLCCLSSSLLELCAHNQNLNNNNNNHQQQQQQLQQQQQQQQRYTDHGRGILTHNLFRCPLVIMNPGKDYTHVILIGANELGALSSAVSRYDAGGAGYVDPVAFENVFEVVDGIRTITFAPMMRVSASSLNLANIIQTIV